LLESRDSSGNLLSRVAFAAAVNVEKKLQKLHTKTSQKDMAKLQIYQLNLANYGQIRNLPNPKKG